MINQTSFFFYEINKNVLPRKNIKRKILDILFVVLNKINTYVHRFEFFELYNPYFYSKSIHDYNF